MSQTVVVTAIFRPAEGQRERVLEALGRAIPRVHQEEGCELYSIQEAGDGRIVMIEKWTSGALLDAHGAGAAVRDLDASLEGLLTEPVEVERLAPIPFGTTRQGIL